MSFLGRFRILTKILSIIMLLSGVAGTLAYLGVCSMKQMNESAETISRSAKRLGLVALATQNVIALNRAEFRSALDPRDDNRLAARKVIEEQLKQFHERFDQVSETRDQQTQALLPAVREAYAAYEGDLKATLAAVDDARSEKLTEAAEKLRDVAMKSRDSSLSLQAKLRAVADRLEQRIGENDRFAAEEYTSASRLMIVMAAVGILLGTIGGFIVGQFGIAKPMRSLVALLGLMARGETVEMLEIERNDEVGETARAIGQIKTMLARKAAEEAEAKVAHDHIVAEQRKADMRRLADGFEAATGEVIETVSSAATELEAAATSLTRTAEQTQRLSTSVASASEEATTNVQSVASATEEMASSVNEISRQLQEAARIAGEAVAKARGADERINSLSQASAKIGDVVELINTIASQTNLLALNATIEAARAGEAGRGFAVVASEVKALAEQTAKATAEIGQQITSIQSATHESVAEMKEIGGVITRISEISSTIASAVEEQGATTQEIARNVQRAAAGTAEVASNITEVSNGAAETGGASSQVLSAAKSLAGDTDRLKLEVEKFLSTVRAA